MFHTWPPRMCKPRLCRLPKSRISYGQEIKSRNDTNKLKELIQQRIKVKNVPKCTAKPSESVEKEVKDSGHCSIARQNTRRSSSSFMIRSKSRSLSPSIDKAKQEGEHSTRLIRPQKVETFNSTLYENFEQECKELPGSDNFIKTHTKPLFDTSRINHLSKKPSQKILKQNFHKKKRSDLAHDQHYEPNLDAIKSRKDLLIPNFRKQLGRPAAGGIFPTTLSYTSLPHTSQPKFSPPGRTQPPCTGFGRFDKSMPRESNTGSMFPSWMQKGYSSRLYLLAITEKALISNCHTIDRVNDAKSMTDRKMIDLIGDKTDTRKSSKNNQKIESDDESSDLDDLLDKYRRFKPIKIDC